MVTTTYDALDDLVHEVAVPIARMIGLPKDQLNLFQLNDALTQYLQGYGVLFEDELDEDE